MFDFRSHYYHGLLDIKRVYTNLLDGSFNHLEAFETTLEVLN